MESGGDVDERWALGPRERFFCIPFRGLMVMCIINCHTQPILIAPFTPDVSSFHSGVTSIIFCVALSAYDLMLAEDEEMNR